MTGRSPPEEDVRHRLAASSLAVLPSREWMADCLAHCRRQSPGSLPPTALDAVLFRVLHADLRDVVRGRGNRSAEEEEEAAADEAPRMRPPECSRTLREGIRGSSDRASGFCRRLPASFALLCQLEGAVDVSRNAEGRLEAHAPGGTAAFDSNSNINSNSNPANGRSRSAGGSRNAFSQQRCLKVLLSDGYPDGGNETATATSTSNSNSNSNNAIATATPIVGVETSLVPGLSASALGGTKILLRGPLEIRHSVLLLHPGNCVVLGGCVPELVRHQAGALEAASKARGVGVDPTIRALIGSAGSEAGAGGTDVDTDTDMDGERSGHDVASGDVVPRVIPPVRATAPRTERSGFASSSSLPLSLSLPSSVPAANNHHSNRNGDAVRRREASHPPSAAATATATATAIAIAIATAGPYRTGNASHQGSGSANPNPATTGSDDRGRTHPVSGPPSANANGNPNPNTAIRATARTTTTTITTTTKVSNPYASGGNRTNPYHRSHTIQMPIRRKSAREAPPGASAIPPDALPRTMETPGSHRPREDDSVRAKRSGTNDPCASASAASSSAAPATGSEPGAAATSRTTTTTTTLRRVTPSHLPVQTSGARPGAGGSGGDDDDGDSQTTRRTTTSAATAAPAIQNISFANLRKLLLRLAGDREMYESYHSGKSNSKRREMVFRVELEARVRNQNDLYFDVVRAKKKSRKSSKREKGKKYEFFAAARFAAAAGEASSASETLSCRIHPAWIEPHFEVPPSELRALSRTNREESLRITNRNGEKVRTAYFGRRRWRATLNLSGEDLFGGPAAAESPGPAAAASERRLTDLKSPILLLEPDREDA